MNKEFQSSLKLLPVRTAPFFAAGIILGSYGGIAAVIITAVAALLATFLFFKYRKGFASALALFVGSAVITLFISLVCQPILEAAGTSQTLQCTVTKKYSYTGSVLYYADTTINGHNTTITFFSGDTYHEGETITADVTLTESTNRTRSPAGEILLRGSIEKIHSVETPEFSIIRNMADFRRHLSSEVGKIIDEDAGALAQGLLFGDTSGFSIKLRTSAKISGVMHFTAVSGSHFAIIMSVLLELVSKKHKKLRAVIAVMTIPLAIMFFGAEPTVIRAGIMLFLCHFGPLLSRSSDTLNSLCVSVIAMTLFTPYVMLDIGFQMSVLGVFGVTVVGTPAKKLVRTFTNRLPAVVKIIIDGIVISSCAVICIAPISVGIFGGISMVGVFATVVLTPIFTAALALGVMFALTGIQPLLIPLGLTIKAAYHVIMLFGCSSRLWLPLNFNGAGLLALICAFALTLAVVAPKKFIHGGLTAVGISCVISVILSIIITGNQRKIVFPSDGNSGAAVICINRTAAVIISGNGTGLENALADCLLENGIYEVQTIAAPDITPTGAEVLGRINEIFPISEIVSAESSVSKYCAGSKIIPQSISEIAVDGITIATAKAGDIKCTADIVLYNGYKKSDPQYGAKQLALYVSSRQNKLPDGAVNIYDEEIIINLN